MNLKGSIYMSDKKISDIIKKMMEQPNDIPLPIPQKEVAEVLGYKLTTFRNKLSLDRFSIDDLMVIAEMCNYNLAFVPKNKKSKKYVLSCNDFLDDVEEKKRLYMFEKKRLQNKSEVLDSFFQPCEQLTFDDFLIDEELKNFRKKQNQHPQDNLSEDK